MTKSYKIGDKRFSTQKELKEYIQSILRNYKPGENLKKDDFYFINKLLSYHPEVKEKTKSGVKSIIIDNAKHGTKCFYVVREDETTDDFSILKCIKGYDNLNH